MIIVDFNGLPGCGKSTYASEVYKKMVSNGDMCYLLNKNEYVLSDKIGNKINDYMRLLILPNLIYNLKLFSKWKQNKFDRKISTKEKIWKTLRIVVLYDKIHRLSKKEGILLIDQGIIQDYADFYINKEHSYNDLLNYAKKYFDIAKKIIIVNCDITEEETIRRIRKRNRKQYDVDKMSDEELEKILKLEK